MNTTPCCVSGKGLLLFSTYSIIFISPRAGFFNREIINLKSLMSKLGEYLQETKGELKHVSWPTKNQAIIFTLMVVIFSVGVAIYLGALDYLFTMILKMFI